MTHNAFALWRNDIGFGTPVFATDLRPFHPINALLSVLNIHAQVPANALLVLGIITTAFAVDRFARTPTRARWAALCITFASAITGCSLGGIVALVVAAFLAFTVRSFRGARRSDDGAAAGSVAALVIGAMLALPWWLPMFQVGSVVSGDPPFNTMYLKEARRIANQPRWFVAQSFAVDFDTQRAVKQLAQMPNRESFAIVDHVPAPVDAVNAFRTRGGVNPLLSAHIRESHGLSVAVSGVGWKLLVSNRAFWPGWRAYQGKQRLRPVRANGAFLGVFVPPGDATVEFRYRPAEVDTAMRVAAVALVLFLGTAIVPWYSRAQRTLPGTRDWRPAAIAISLQAIDARLARIHRPRVLRVIALLLLIAYAVVLLAYCDAIAGGADSSGYMSQARLWARGQVIRPVRALALLGLPPEFDRAFMPLGFVRGAREGLIVPSYPAGLPLHFAAVQSVFGERAIRFVVPLISVAAVVLMFFLARAGGASAPWAFAAAALLAMCPVYVMHALQPVSDVVATFWALLAAYCALRGQTHRMAAFAGAAFAIGVVVRPTNALMLPALLLLIPRPRRILTFLAAGVPVGVLQLGLNRALYGSPFTSGYGSITDLIQFRGFSLRLHHYITWLAALIPGAFPFGLAAFAMRRIDRRTRVACAVWFIAFFVFYCSYTVYEDWWYVRFLLPAVPAILLLGALAATIALQRFPALSTTLAIAATLVLASSQLATNAHFDMLITNELERKYPNVVFNAQPFLRKDAIVICAQFSGALNYYAPEVNPLRLEYLKPDNFATVRAHAEARGLPIHALVEEREIPELRRNAPGQWVVMTGFRETYLLRLMR